MKTLGFQGRYASAIASLRSSRLFVYSLLEPGDRLADGSGRRAAWGERAGRAGRNGPGGWWRKFAVAGRGIGRVLLTESSFRVHLPAAASAVAAGAWFRVTPGEWAALALAIGGVFTAEVFNSAIERLARGPAARRHPRLRDALDMAAGAVLLAALTAVAVAAAIFLPRLLDLASAR
jgi:diacylglycerol kinase